MNFLISNSLKCWPLYSSCRHYLRSLKISRNGVQSRQFTHRKSIPKSTLTSVGLSFASLTDFIGLNQQSKLDKLMYSAKELLEDGKIDDALILYSEALGIAETDKLLDEICTIKEKMGVIAFSSQQYEVAEKFLISAREAYIHTGTSVNDPKVLNINLRLAETYDFLDQTAKSEELYELCSSGIKSRISAAVASNSKEDDEFIYFYLAYLTSRAHFCVKHGHVDDAHNYFTRAYALSKKINGEVSEQSVKLLQQLGVICYKKGEIDLAVSNLNQAIEFGKRLPGMVDLANAYISLGNIYLKQGLLKAASQACDQGLKNSERHDYAEGIKEATACLEQIAAVK